jgi:hypothetical protein
MAKAAKKVVKKAAVRKPVAKPVARRPKAPHRAKPTAVASGNKERFTLHGFALSGPTYTVALITSISEKAPTSSPIILSKTVTDRSRACATARYS